MVCAAHCKNMVGIHLESVNVRRISVDNLPGQKFQFLDEQLQFLDGKIQFLHEKIQILNEKFQESQSDFFV